MTLTGENRFYQQLIDLDILGNQDAEPLSLLQHGVARYRQRLRGRGCRLRGAYEQAEQVVQFAVDHRLGQIAVHPQAPAALRIAAHPHARHEYALDRIEGRLGTDLPHQLPTVALRHLHVDQQEVEAGPAGAGRQDLPRLAGAGRLDRAHPPVAQKLGQHPAVHRQVVHQQGPPPRERGLLRRRVRDLLQGEAGREAEGAPPAGLALDADLAVHQFYQMLADGEAEPGPAERLGGGEVRLLEGVEDELLLFRRDADPPVLHAEAEQAAVFILTYRSDPDHDGPAGGELDGVADQVDHDLAQAPGVADQRIRRLGGGCEEHLETPFGGTARDGAQRLAHAGAQQKGGAVQLDPAHLDLGEVEDVVHDGKEVAGRAFHRVQVGFLVLA